MIAQHQKPFCFLLLIFCFCQNAHAQPDLSKWKLGLNAGMYIYQGDLTPSFAGSYRSPRYGISVNVVRLLSTSFSIRANLAIAGLAGADALYNDPAWRQQRNFSFSTPLKEVSCLAVYDLFHNNDDSRGFRISPYVFAGLGVSLLNTHLGMGASTATFLTHEPTAGYGLLEDLKKSPSKVIPVIPLGVGARYYLSSHWSLALETNFRYTFTDYIDGVKYAADPRKKDFYHSHDIGLVYSFGKRDRYGCPTVF